MIRTTRAFFAVAAGATIAALGLAATPAGAGTARHHHPVYFTPSAPETGTDANCASPGFGNEMGTWHSSDCAKTGYVATGRDFRFISSTVTIPDHAPTSADELAYVALDASSADNDFARAGIYPCYTCGPATWLAYVDVQESGTTHFFQAALAGAQPGDGVNLSVYLVPTGNSVHVTVTTASGTAINKTYDVSGPVYTAAQAFADWTVPAAVTEPAPAPATGVKSRDLQFQQGRITTASGDRGTFKGPWSLTAVDGTSNGHLSPSGTLISQPSFLWNDGQGFNGQGSDAFGVWRFPF